MDEGAAKEMQAKVAKHIDKEKNRQKVKLIECAGAFNLGSPSGVVNNLNDVTKGA